MKTKMILSVIAIGLAVAGCTKLKKLATVSVDIPYNQQVSIPAIPGGVSGTPLPAGGALLPLPSIPVPTNSKQYLKQYNTTAEKVLLVDLKRLTLEIVTPPGQNFNFIDFVEVYISARSQPEQLLAFQYTVPAGQTTLELTTSKDVNLKDYFLQDTMYLRMNAHVNAVPISGTELKINSVFHLLANPLE